MLFNEFCHGFVGFSNFQRIDAKKLRTNSVSIQVGVTNTFPSGS
jgi:hypothetical protein